MDFLLALDAFFATYINDILFWIVAFFLSWNAYILLFNKGVPNTRSAPSIRALMIEAVKKDFEARGKKDYKLIELGSGNGLFSRELATALPEVHITGIEVAHKSYWWSKFMARLCGHKNLSYARADCFKYDISDVDAVLYFLSAYEVGRMTEKLTKEAKKGAIIVSNRFALRDPWKPQETIEAKDMSAVEKLRYPFQGKVHIYYKA